MFLVDPHAKSDQKWLTLCVVLARLFETTDILFRQAVDRLLNQMDISHQQWFRIHSTTIRHSRWIEQAKVQEIPMSSVIMALIALILKGNSFREKLVEQ